MDRIGPITSGLYALRRSDVAELDQIDTKWPTPALVEFVHFGDRRGCSAGPEGIGLEPAERLEMHALRNRYRLVTARCVEQSEEWLSTR